MVTLTGSITTDSFKCHQYRFLKESNNSSEVEVESFFNLLQIIVLFLIFVFYSYDIILTPFDYFRASISKILLGNVVVYSLYIGKKQGVLQQYRVCTKLEEQIK